MGSSSVTAEHITKFAETTFRALGAVIRKLKVGLWEREEQSLYFP